MLLDFEKPIAELEGKLDDMKHLASDSDKEVQTISTRSLLTLSNFMAIEQLVMIRQ
jgi:acetyl-CoA carboxylase alpha subunit